ncbi:MAG: dihydrodipicolinate reductase [Verrucomicrobiota bacterium]
MKIKIAQFGLGPIGIETLKLAATKPWAEIVGGIDIDPAKIGRSLSQITGIKGLESTRIHSSFDELLRDVKPDAVLHTSVSRMKQAFPQLEPIVRAGVNVVSSCEELLFPQLKEPALARQLDELCRKHQARVLGTGVNPGYVMDTLAVCLTGVCRNVERIEIERVVNASLRRLPLQKKIGSGLEPDEFRKLFRENKMGHVGLVESLALVAHCLNWKIGEIKETCEPMIAASDIKTEFLEVKKGLTCGIHHRAEAATNGQINLTLDLKMYLEAENPRDAVKIFGDPPIDAVLQGGVHGDRATVAALVNAVPTLLKANPGLLLMTDIAVPRVS